MDAVYNTGVTTTATASNLTAALEQWRTLLGAERVLTDEESRQAYQRSTIPAQLLRTIAAVLLPGSVSEVQEAVRIAASLRVPLYPISAGHNWGYGTANPAGDLQVVLDLSRLTHIEVNEELAYAVIEPGVTQEQLYRHLNARRIPLWIDPTGAGPSASLLGNAVERGFGIGAYGDHFANVCGMEVVLADGRLLRTGFGQWVQAKAAHVFRWGVGPYLDGLFSQSNLGIVVRLGLWLMPKPESFSVCLFRTEHDEALGPLITAVRSLLLDRVIDSGVNLVSRNRALTLVEQYPWAAMDGRTPMSDAVAARLARQHGIARWNGIAAVYGSREQVAASCRVIRRRLRGALGAAAQVQFVSDRTWSRIRKYPALASLLTGIKAGELLTVLGASVGIFTGQPSRVALHTVFWRSRRPTPDAAEPIDPARERCGLMWVAPVVPMTADDVRAVLRLVEPLVAEHGFECCPTFSSVTARAFDMTLPILFDPQVEHEAQRAAACAQQVLEACAKAGYLPYRLGIQSMAWLTSQPSAFWDVVTELKRALDPAGILAPGRYARPTVRQGTG